MSNAHIFRKEWIDQLFPQPGTPYRHERRDLVGGTGESEWESSAADLKVKDVCRSCNSSWMNDLDLAAEDAFATRAAIGHYVKLAAPADKAVLARWCCLIAVLFDRASETPCLGAATHRALRAGRVPDGAMVWLAATVLDAGWSRLAFGSTGRLTLKGDVLAPEQRDTEHGVAYFMTFGVGQLIAQVLLPTPLTRQGARIERRLDPKLLRQLWPDPIVPFGWPPPLKIRPSEMQDFVRGIHWVEAPPGTS